MPKYMEQAQLAYGAVVDAVNNDVERLKRDGNKELVVDSVNVFDAAAESTMRSVRENWRDSATERIGQLGLQVTTEVQEANNNNQIIPPLNEGDINVLGMRRAMYAGLAESANRRESNSQTPTEAIDTDAPKQ